jgi:nicotinamide mononucleotide transporter
MFSSQEMEVCTLRPVTETVAALHWEMATVSFASPPVGATLDRRLLHASLLRRLPSSLPVSVLEIAAVAFGLASVYLSTRENIWSWPTAIVNVALYAVLFWREKLYADMGLQLIFFALSIYGWYEWLYGGENKTELFVSRLTRRTAVGLLAIAVTGSFTLGFILRRATDASLPWLDATLSVFSLVAQWMMTRKILENWIVWIALDIVYVGMFVFLKDLYLTGFQYAVFLALAVVGQLQWLRSYQNRSHHSAVVVTSA